MVSSRSAPGRRPHHNTPGLAGLAAFAPWSPEVAFASTSTGPADAALSLTALGAFASPATAPAVVASSMRAPTAIATVRPRRLWGVPPMLAAGNQPLNPGATPSQPGG